MDKIASFFPSLHWYSFLIIPGLIIGFTIHELGHSLTAYFLGDTSQVKQGNITANPIKHISWLGTTLFILFGIGWPKPLRFDPRNFKDKYLDSLLVALAGPVANLAASVLVFVSSLLVLSILRMTNQLDGTQVNAILFFSRTTDLATLTFSQAWENVPVWMVALTNRVWVANFALAIVSLIPLPPFDGFTAALSVLGIMKDKRLSQLTKDDPVPPPQSMLIKPTPTSSKKQSIADIHLKLGVEYHQQQRFDDAIARYRLAIEVDPSFGPAYVNMGLAYNAKGQTNEAIHALRGATLYASDEKSQNQAWVELHKLNGLPTAPVQPQAKTPGNPESLPWTDIKPTPNWTTFGAGLIIFVLFFSCILGFLIASLFSGGH